MEYVKLGETGLEVSRLCLGTMSYGSPEWRDWVLDEKQSRPFFERALEAGINFFDTADMYSRGLCEELVGRVLGELASRDELVIATKLFFPLRDGGANRAGLSRKRILDCVDASLRRLGSDYIDLYQIHRFDPETPLDETLRALDDCVRAGKVRYLGASSGMAWELARALYRADALGLSRFVSMQNHYNLVFRDEEREVLPLCRAEGLGVIPYSPLARGFLAGTRHRGDWQRTLRARTDAFGQAEPFRDCDYAVLQAVIEVAAECGASPAQVALSWVTDRPGISSPIIGATRIEQLDEALAALELELTSEQSERLEAPYQPRPDRGFL